MQKATAHLNIEKLSIQEIQVYVPVAVGRHIDDFPFHLYAQSCRIMHRLTL